MQVRRAVSDDVPWLCDALRAFAAHYPAPIPLYTDHAQAEALVRSLMAGHYIAVAHHAIRGPVGLVAGLCQPHPFNPALRIATELFWWVNPDARGTSAGGRLFSAFEAWAVEQGADAIAMSLEASTPLADDAMTRRGYVPVERQFLRPLPVS